MLCEKMHQIRWQKFNYPVVVKKIDHGVRSKEWGLSPVPTLIYLTPVDIIGVGWGAGSDNDNPYPLNAIKAKFAVGDTCFCLCQIPCYLVN